MSRRTLSLIVTFVLIGAVPKDDRDAIQEMLDRRAEALLQRDRAAFMATVSKASPSFVARQRRFFRGISSVPLARYELTARWIWKGDMAVPADRRHYPDADRVHIPQTEERYRIEGFDRSDAVEQMFYTYVREDGKWLVGDDVDLEPIGLLTARHMWDFGPLYALRSPHFLLLGHPCGVRGALPDCGEVPGGFLDLAERALARVDRFWQERWAGRVVVLVPGSQDELRRMLQVTYDPSNFVAFAYTSVDGSRGVKYTAPRIVFNRESLTTRSTQDIEDILTHELLHVATRGAAGPFTPTFIEEGFADYVGRDADPAALAFLNAEAAAGSFDRTIPRDEAFVSGDPTSIFRSYQEAHSVTRFVVERWSLRRFIRFYKDLGSRNSVPGTPRYHLEDAFRDTFGMGYSRFERAWADSIAG